MAKSGPKIFKYIAKAKSLKTTAVTILYDEYDGDYKNKKRRPPTEY